MVSDKARAYHEAAHAVIAVVLDIPIEFTTIEITTDETGRKLYGHTKYKKVSEEEKRKSFLHKIISAFAPLYTVNRLGEEMAVLGCINDIDKVEATVAYVPEEEREEIFQTAKNEAKEEVEKHWRSIVAVADALLAKKTLTDKEVKEIISKTQVTFS